MTRYVIAGPSGLRLGDDTGHGQSLAQQESASHRHPYQLPGLAHDGERDAGRAAKREQFGKRRGAGLINPDAHRHHLERDLDEPVRGLEQERVEHRGGDGANQGQHDVHLEHRQPVEYQLPRCEPGQATRFTWVEPVDAVLHASHASAPAREPSTRPATLEQIEEPAGDPDPFPDDGVGHRDKYDERDHHQRHPDQPPDLGSAETERQRQPAAGNDERGRQGVEEVLDGQGREGSGYRLAVAREERLGRFADQDTEERHHIADGVAGDHRAKRQPRSEPVRPAYAAAPGHGSRGESHSPQRHDAQEAPPQTLNVIGDVSQAGPSHVEDEQRGSHHGGGDTEQRDTGPGGAAGGSVRHAVFHLATSRCGPA